MNQNTKGVIFTMLGGIFWGISGIIGKYRKAAHGRLACDAEAFVSRTAYAYAGGSPEEGGYIPCMEKETDGSQPAGILSVWDDSLPDVLFSCNPVF